MKRKKKVPTNYRITTEPNGLIRVKIYGTITGTAIERMAGEAKRISAEQRKKSQSVLVAVDLSEAGKINSKARILAKKALGIDYDRVAFFGANAELSRVVLYLIRSVGVFRRAHYYSSEAAAIRWLKTGRDIEPPFNFTKKTAAIVIAACLFVIGSWFIFSGFFKFIIEKVAPVNPLGMLSLIVLGIILWLTTQQDDDSKLKKNISIGLISLLYVASLFILINLFLLHSNPLTADKAIFGSKITQVLPYRVPYSLLAIIYILIISLGIFITEYSHRVRVRLLGQILLMTSLIGVCLNLIGYIFGFPRLYTIYGYAPLSIFSSIIFLLIIISSASRFPDLIIYQLRPRLNRVWAVSILVFIILFSITGIIWQQVKHRETSDRIQMFNQKKAGLSTLISENMYDSINTLYGFRGLFDASDFVSRQDFRNYYNSLTLTKNNPDFYAIAYIQKVPRDQVDTFVNKVRSDDSLNPPLANFSIFPFSEKPEYLVKTYVEQPSGTQVPGEDMARDPARLATYDSAAKQNAAVASGTIVPLTQPTKQFHRGFFITIPIYNKGIVESLNNTMERNLTGFVTMTFDYDNYLGSLLKNQVDDGAYIMLSNHAEQKPIFQSAPSESFPKSGLSGDSTINIVGQQWNLHLVTRKDYGVSEEEKIVPHLVLFSGLLISLLTTLIFAAIARSRKQALELADVITKDLRRERNSAINTQREYNAILRSIADGVIAIDTDGRIILFNPTAARLTGYPAEKAIGRPYYEVLIFINEINAKENNQFIKNALKGRTQVVTNHYLLAYSPKRRVRIRVASTAAPIRDEKAPIHGAIIVFRDVTSEWELQKAKDDFVSLASHQLRTPATGVKQYVGLLLEGYVGKLTNKQSVMLKKAYESNERQLQIISDLLNVAHLDAGRVILNRETTDIKKMMTDVIKEQLSSFHERNQQLIFHKPRERVMANVDPDRFRMVVENLLNNAGKYTPEGKKVEVTLEVIRAKIFIRFKDQGVGISKDDQRLLFQKFTRIPNPLSSQAGGTGLGLYWAKRIVDLHGGTISVASRLNKGSEFIIIIPGVTK